MMIKLKFLWWRKKFCECCQMQSSWSCNAKRGKFSGSMAFTTMLLVSSAITPAYRCLFPVPSLQLIDV